ncbi:hypothetical protein [Haloferula sargassicola]|uniref:Uncharacterized protein n=1 Tax=Haloferula sargassicola TaxID=490096 RepID=A0ABP9UQR6_9BACT
MHPSRPDRPFLAAWLRRTRKQLAPSGRLSELALILSRKEGGTPGLWSDWLRRVLDEEISPTLDELTAIDLLLARPKPAAAPDGGLCLF